MKWLRNLLFIGLVGGGVLALGTSLMPPRQTNALTHFDPQQYRDAAFRATVDRVDYSDTLDQLLARRKVVNKARLREALDELGVVVHCVENLGSRFDVFVEPPEVIKDPRADDEFAGDLEALIYR